MSLLQRVERANQPAGGPPAVVPELPHDEAKSELPVRDMLAKRLDGWQRELGGVKRKLEQP